MANLAEINNIIIRGKAEELEEVYLVLSTTEDDGFSYQTTPDWNFDGEYSIEGSTCGRWNDADFVITMVEFLEDYPSLQITWYASDESMDWRSISKMDAKTYECVTSGINFGSFRITTRETATLTRENIYNEN